MIATLADALALKGYDTLTPVQEAVTDPALAGRDLLVSAQTGSGKTVGFGLAIGPTILAPDGTFGPATTPLALIIAPTRELALQVKRELSWLYAGAGVVMAQAVGGMDMRDERRALERGAHIVVATPGRLKDHILRGSLDLSNIRAIVLDEADEMLDLGFREDLEFILAEAPASRRTLMFSATVPPMIVKLAQSYQTDAARVTTVTKESQHADIAYRALQCANHDVDNAIINVLRFYDAPNAIVFANTRAMVTRLTTRLSNRGFAVVALSGELSQSERSHALQAMRDGRARVCVATDVAARGIDLPNLELVIHAELPTNAEILLHRSGRTGRAGRKGISAMIVPPKMKRRAQNLLTWGKLSADWGLPPTADEILAADEARLMSDPIWTDEYSEAEQAFAARLLAAHDPAQIAAAYLRLYQNKQSAPEDLSPVVDMPDRHEKPKREKREFGPSRWFAVDVGREGKAEARWLLPMICKAGEITKNEIGAIRIQPDQTYVEIAQPAVAGFLAAIGPEMRLENQARMTALDGPPQLSAARGPRPDKRDYQSGSEPSPRPARVPRARDTTPPPPSRQEDLAAIVPGAADDPAPRKPRASKSAARDHAGAVFAKGGGPRKTSNSEQDAAKPYKGKSDTPGKGKADAPYRGKPGASAADKAGKSGRPNSQPAYRSKDGGAASGKEKSGPSGKTPGKSADRPAKRASAEGAAPRGFKPKQSGTSAEGKPFRARAEGLAKPRADAADTSKRFVPPGAKPKPRGGPGKPGGSARRTTKGR